MDLTLDKLLAELQGNLEKSAAEAEKDESDDKEKGKPAFLKEKESEDKEKKGDDEDGEKSPKEDDEDKEKGQEKSASEAGAALAREVFEKIAALQLNTPETPMNKQASTAGQALAQALLKKASTEDLTSSNGIAPGAVPNKAQVANAQMVAETDAVVKPMPTSDGLRPTGTLNEVFDAIIQDALAQGAAGVDQVNETGIADKEGNVEDHAVPNQVGVEKAAAVAHLVAQGVDFGDAVELVKQAEAEIADEMEKAAAMASLIEQGIDFDQAVEMVKQAEAEIAEEDATLTKAAYLQTLIEGGVDFDSAVEMVKQASAEDLTSSTGIAPGAVPNKAQVANAQIVAESDAVIKPMPTSDGLRPTGTMNEVFDAIIQDALAQGAAGGDQVNVSGIADKEGMVEDHAVPNQVKVAYVTGLVEQGMDYEDAVELVKKASAGASDVARGIFSPAGMNRHIDDKTGGENSGIGRRAKENVVGSLRATGRGVAESLGGALVGGMTGGGLSLLSRGRISHSAAVTGGNLLGGTLGLGHGVVESLKNQANERYARNEKKAALIGEVLNAGQKLTGRALTTPAAAGVAKLAKPGMGLGKKLAIGAGAGYAANKALGQQKQAAVAGLMDLGVDFDQAVELVNAKSQELFGG
jgi:flavin-binding protein dodecin